jgi:flagellar basal body-associated protein FliL
MEPETTPPKKGKGKLIAIVGGAVVVGAAAYFFLGMGGGGGDAEAAAVTTTTIAEEGAVIEADEMTVNLADPSPRYARLRFAVVLPVGGDSATVGERFPLLKDRVLDIMSAFTAEQLLAPGGLDQMRAQLTAESQEVWPDGEVMRVLVTELLVQ